MGSNAYKDIIGSGVLFPIELTKNDVGNTGWYPVVGDTRLIENNLEALFLHQIGAKMRDEDFGTRIWECLEEPNSQAQAFVINQFMKEAFETWEDRIAYKKTELLREGSKLYITFYYQIININSTSSSTAVYDSNNSTLNI
jgi:phage baseplate assembly protein W